MGSNKKVIKPTNQHQTVFKDENGNDIQEKKTGSGLEQNIAGALCYLVGFVTGIIFLVIEKENRFVRFHAFQSIFISVIIIVVNTILTISLIGIGISLLLGPLTLLLWLFLLWKAYQGEMYKLPVIGQIALEQVDKK